MAAPITSNVLNVLANTFFTNDIAYCKQMLLLINNNFVFKNQSVSQIKDCVGQIHDALNSQHNRIEALCLLSSLIDQCSEDLIIQYSKTWMNALIHNLQSSQDAPGQSENSVIHTLTCAVMDKLLANCARFPEVSRNVSVHFIPQLVQALLGATASWIASSLSCLTSVIHHFPAASGTFKGRIEGVVIKNLENASCQKEASRCLAILAQCGSRGNQGSHHTDGWSSMFIKLLGSLGEVLSQLYQGFEAGQPSSLPLTRFRLPPIGSECSPQTCSRLSNRYRVLADTLCVLLSNEFGSVVKIPVELLLQLLFRAVAINNTMLLSVPVTRNLVTSCVIPDIHLSTVNILDALIIFGKRHLLRYDNSISRLIMQCLAWTRQNTDSAATQSSHAQDYGFIREAVYNVAAHWLSVAKLSSGILTMTEFINHMISDIKPPADTLKIAASGADIGSGGLPPTKKRKRADVNQPMKAQNTGTALTIAANQKLCTAALTALRQLLQTAGHHLSVESMKIIHGCITISCLSLQDGKKLTSLFTSPAVRHALYHVLLTAVLVPHPSWPSPVHLAINLFRIGMKDQGLQVSDFCTEAITSVEHLIHPRAPVLQKSVILKEDPIIISRRDIEVKLAIPADDRMAMKRHLPENMASVVRSDEFEVSPKWSDKELHNKSNTIVSVNIANAVVSLEKDAHTDVYFKGQVTNGIAEGEKGDEEKVDTDDENEDEQDDTVKITDIEMIELDNCDDVDSGDVMADIKHSKSRDGVDKVSDSDSQNDASTVTYEDIDGDYIKVTSNGVNDVPVAVRKEVEATEAELQAMLMTFVNVDPDT